MGKIRIAFLLPKYFEDVTGGAELQVMYLIEYLKKATNWDIHYIFLSPKKRFKNPFSINLHPIKERKLWLKLGNIQYPYVFQIWKKLKIIKPDIIYQRTTSSFSCIAALYKHIYNSKLFFHIASDKDVSSFNDRIKWMKYLNIKAPLLIIEDILADFGIKKSDFVILQTKYQKRMLEKNYKKSGILIRNAHPIPSTIVKKSKSKIIVLWIANWKKVKQPEIFIKLVENLKYLPNVRWIMIGRNKEYKKLVEKALENKINVLGEIPNENVNEWLEKAHILVNTSQYEGFSNTFIQAWLREVPVVSLNVDPDNLIKTEKIGYCSKNFLQLVNDVETLILNNNIREEMGKRAKKVAIREFSITNFEKLIELFKKVIAKN